MIDSAHLPTLDDLATLMRCVQCGGAVTPVPGALRCARGHAYPVEDGVVVVREPGEDPAVERERRAVLDLEAAPPGGGAEGSTSFTLASLLAARGPMQEAFLSLPYDDGSAFYRENEYFRNVAGFAGAFDYLLGELDLPAGSRVLDIGADLTWSTARLARRGWRAVGIDINHHLAAARLFREHGVAFDVVNMDMHATAFADGVFDAVTAFNALHHTHRLGPLVANLARMLRMGGRLAFVEPYWFLEAVREAFGVAQIEAGINENVYRLEEWHQTFVSHGFELRSFAASHAFIGVYEKAAGPAAARRPTLDQARDELFAPFYGAGLALRGPRAVEVRAGAATTIPVRVMNRSARTWCRDGQIPVRAGYHLYAAAGPGGRKGRLVAFENPRSHLPEFLRPGGEADVDLRVDAPAEPGDYVVEVDLLQEGVTWFVDRGLPPQLVDLRVVA